MNNILLSSAGRRVELAQAFQAEISVRGLSIRLLSTDLNPKLSAVSEFVDLAVKSPRVTDAGYVDFLLDLCKTQSIGLVVPTIDTELLLLAQHREAFAAEGIQLVISDASLVSACRDKRVTAGLFAELGIDSPEIYNRDDRAAIPFPCFVKPYDGSRSIGARVLPDSNALDDALLANPKMMFMALVDGTHIEFTVDAYFDRSGQLSCLVPRQRIEVRDGEISKGATRRHAVYDYLLPKLKALKGARGCITLQLFADVQTGQFAAIEINPRFGGGFPLSYSAGANYPGWLIDEYLLGKQVPFFDGWEADLLMLRYDAKVLVHGAS
jgi:carbamoyl-phosphate synthase large subunit